MPAEIQPGILPGIYLGVCSAISPDCFFMIPPGGPSRIPEGAPSGFFSRGLLRILSKISPEILLKASTDMP